MRAPRRRVALLGLTCIILPLLMAERCANDPAHIQVTDVTLNSPSSRSTEDAESSKARPGTISEAGRFTVASGIPGTLTVTFTADVTFTICNLSLDGYHEVRVYSDGKGKYVVQKKTAALVPYALMGGTLTCIPTTGIVEPAVSNFSVNSRPLARLVATPTKLDFGGVIVGQTSSPQTVKVKNEGDAPAVVAYLIGSNGKDFVASSSLPTNAIVHVGQQFTITVRFAPTAPGVQSGVVAVETGQAVPVTLFAASGRAGTSYNPVFAMTLNHLDYGSFDASLTREKFVIVTNNGINPLHIASTQMTGNDTDAYVVTDTSCVGATLATGDSCRLAVTFQPTRGGYRTAVVRISDDAAGSPHELTLTGEGIAAATPTPTPTPEPPAPQPPAPPYPYPP
jgi:hypothetical protein